MSISSAGKVTGAPGAISEVRSGPLCWAQQWLWLVDVVVAGGARYGRMVWWRVEVGGGIPLPAVRRIAARLLAEHETLRTVYRRGVDGLPIQVVLSGLEPRLVFVDLDGDDDPPASDHLPDYYDLSTELTFTGIVGVRGDTVHRLYFVVHRIAVDGVSWALLHDQIAKLVRNAEGGMPVEPIWQPIDQAEVEAGDEARGVAERSARFWEDELAKPPHASLPIYWDGNGAPSYETSVLVDRALLERIAQRCRVTAPTVIQALLTILCGGWAGQRSVALGTVTANRGRRRMASSIGRFASMVRIVVELDQPGPSFDAFVRAVHAKLFQAYIHGPHSVGDMTMREIRHSARAGARIVCAIFFEYHHYGTRGDEAGPGGSSLPATDVRQSQLDGHVPQLRFDVFPSGTVLRLAVRCPSCLLDSAGAKAFLVRFRELVDRVAAGDQPTDRLLESVDLPRPWVTGNWVSVRQAWINLDDVTRLLTEHRAVSTATAFVERDHPERIVARVVPQAGVALSASELDDHMRDVVTHFPSAMVPHRYEISGVDDASATPPSDPREAALVDAFRACHDGRPPVLTGTYADSGGRFLRMLDVVERLAEAGYAGVSWRDLSGFAPMRAIAAKLTNAAQHERAE